MDSCQRDGAVGGLREGSITIAQKDRYRAVAAAIVIVHDGQIRMPSPLKSATVMEIGSMPAAESTWS